MPSYIRLSWSSLRSLKREYENVCKCKNEVLSGLTSLLVLLISNDSFSLWDCIDSREGSTLIKWPTSMWDNWIDSLRLVIVTSHRDTPLLSIHFPFFLFNEVKRRRRWLIQNVDVIVTDNVTLIFFFISFFFLFCVFL